MTLPYNAAAGTPISVAFTPTGSTTAQAVDSSLYSYANGVLTFFSGAKMTTAGTFKISYTLDPTANVSAANAANKKSALSVSGTINVGVTNARLFPTVGFVNASLGQITGTYSFDTAHDTTSLSFNIQNLSISLSNVLTLQLGNVTITPGAANSTDPIMTVPVATISSSLFAGLGSIQITNFQMFRTGFQIGTLVIMPGQSVTDSFVFPSAEAANTQAFLTQTPEDPTKVTVVFTGTDPATNQVVTEVLATGATTGTGNKTLTLPALPFAGTVTATYAAGSTTAPINIGNFLQITNASLTLTGFKVDATAGAVTGVLTLAGGVNLFPGSSGSPVNVSGHLGATLDFSQPGSTTFTMTITQFVLTVGFLLQVSAGTITITPSEPTIATIDTATITILPLGISGTLHSLAITQSGFTIGSVTLGLATGVTSVTLGGALEIDNPVLSFNNVAYTNGGSITGTLHFQADSASLNLGAANASITHNPMLPGTEAISGDYDIANKTVQLSLQKVHVDLPLISLDATGVSLFYQPEGNTSKLLVGATGVSITAGPSGGPQLAITNATLALAVFDNGSITYALDASGAFSITGLPTGLVFGATNVEARINNTGLPVNESINVNGTILPLVFGSSETVTPGNNGTTLTLAGTPADLTKVTVNVVVDGVSTTLDPSNYTVATGSPTIITLKNYTLPSGATVVVGYFTGDISQGAVSQVLVSGVTLQIGGAVTVTGNFSFTQSGTGASKMLLVGATNVTATIGDSSMGVSLTNGTFGMEIYFDTAQNNSVYALDAKGTVNLFGFGNALQFTAANVELQANTTGAPVTDTPIPVPGGSFDLALAGGGNTVVFHATGVTLNIAGFATVQGDFNFSQNSTTVGGVTSTEIQVGATVQTAFLGAGGVGLTLTGGELGLVLFRQARRSTDLCPGRQSHEL